MPRVPATRLVGRFIAGYRDAHNLPVRIDLLFSPGFLGDIVSGMRIIFCRRSRVVLAVRAWMF
jgi:hypothetical protein